VKCRLCERQAEDSLCLYHKEARRKVESAYHRWLEAYGAISRAEYLRRIVENSETGEWAADIAKMMLSEYE
jgi:hypothetical protein